MSEEKAKKQLREMHQEKFKEMQKEGLTAEEEQLMKILNDINPIIINELIMSNQKHDWYFNTPHEGYAVLKEELEELWDDIKKDDLNNAFKEASQVAAVSIKLMYSLSIYGAKLEKKKVEEKNDTEN